MSVCKISFLYSWILTCIYVQLFEILWTIAHQALLSMGFSRQEYWGGFPCLPPWIMLSGRSQLPHYWRHSSNHRRSSPSTGTPHLGPQTRWPGRNWAVQEVSGRWASFICIYSRFLSLTLPPELRLLSDQQQHYVLIGRETLLSTVHARDLGCALPRRI